MRLGWVNEKYKWKSCDQERTSQPRNGYRKWDLYSKFNNTEQTRRVWRREWGKQKQTIVYAAQNKSRNIRNGVLWYGRYLRGEVDLCIQQKRWKNGGSDQSRHQWDKLARARIVPETALWISSPRVRLTLHWPQSHKDRTSASHEGLMEIDWLTWCWMKVELAWIPYLKESPSWKSILPAKRLSRFENFTGIQLG